MVGGSIFVDQTVLATKGSAKRALIGVPSAGPQADTWDNPRWQAWVKRYQDAFPANQRFPSPSLSGTAYYNAMNALIRALNSVNGDLSNNHQRLRAALASMVLEAPNGNIRLDGNRQAIGNNFIYEIAENAAGDLVSKPVRVIENVNQTLGMDPAKFREIARPSRTAPECKKTY
jgi:hypothetical protein